MFTRRQILGLVGLGSAGVLVSGTYLHLHPDTGEGGHEYAPFDAYESLTDDQLLSIQGAFESNHPGFSGYSESERHKLFREDFENDRIVLVDGWAVSESELALAMVENRLP